ncbi:MAG: hypothetical protein WBN94_11380 [Methanothrix sp.]
MICLRCGQCCLHLDIFVVNPFSILADGSIDPYDQEAMIFKLAGQRCPHLSNEGGHDGCLAVCTIHHLPCYWGTPCEQFEQVGPEDAVCIMSGYFQTLAEKR